MVWESSLNLTTERRKPLSLHLQRVFRSPTIDQEAIFGENYDLPHTARLEPGFKSTEEKRMNERGEKEAAANTNYSRLKSLTSSHLSECCRHRNSGILRRCKQYSKQVSNE